MSDQHDFFRSHGFLKSSIVRSEDGSKLDIAELPPFLRTLLVADGTVTKSLEAYFWEPVSVETLTQESITLEHALPWLNCAEGNPVLQRKVLLRGQVSKRVFAYADSYLRTQDLPNEITEGMLSGQLGIGELLREMGLETYREVLDLGRTPEACGETGRTETHIYRTYVIHLNGRPSIQITEQFPLRVFEEDS